LPEYQAFGGSWVLHRLVFLLCSNREWRAHGAPYPEVFLLLLSEGYDKTQIQVALNYLALTKEIEKIEEPVDRKKWEECLRRAKGDKRVKNEKKYCMRRIPTLIYVKPKESLCLDFRSFLETIGYIIEVPPSLY